MQGVQFERLAPGLILRKATSICSDPRHLSHPITEVFDFATSYRMCLRRWDAQWLRCIPRQTQVVGINGQMRLFSLVQERAFRNLLYICSAGDITRDKPQKPRLT